MHLHVRKNRVVEPQDHGADTGAEDLGFVYPPGVGVFHELGPGFDIVAGDGLVVFVKNVVHDFELHEVGGASDIRVEWSFLCLRIIK